MSLYTLNMIYNNLKKLFINIIFVIIFLNFSYIARSNDSNDTCSQEALKWIEEIDIEEPDILEKHALAKCQFASKWLNGSQKDGSNRKRVCNDLVLIWTYKECIYFRDYITHEAYEPCKSWSREMYSRCMEYDDTWFK